MAHIITFTISFPLIYSLAHIEVEVDDPKPPPAVDIDRAIHLGVTVSVTLWFTIYLVKFSFLTFYRKLFGVFSEFMVAWWIVLVFTAVTFLADSVAVFWACGTPEDFYNASEPTLFSFCKGL